MSHLQLGHLNCNLPRRSLGFYPIEETFAGANTNNSTQAPSNEIVSPNPPPQVQKCLAANMEAKPPAKHNQDMWLCHMMTAAQKFKL